MSSMTSSTRCRHKHLTNCIAFAAEYLHGEVLDLMKLKVKASSKGKKGAPAPDKTVSLPLLGCQGIPWGML